MRQQKKKIQVIIRQIDARQREEDTGEKQKAARINMIEYLASVLVTRLRWHIYLSPALFSSAVLDSASLIGGCFFYPALIVNPPTLCVILSNSTQDREAVENKPVSKYNPNPCMKCNSSEESNQEIDVNKHIDTSGIIRKRNQKK